MADAVGVTPPSIYLHFADKNELLWEVCQEQFRKLDQHMERAAAGARDAVDELRRRGRAYVDFGLANAEAYRVLFMGQGHSEHVPEAVDPSVKEGDATFGHLIAAVQRGIDAGLLRPEPPESIGLGLWATAHGIASLLIAIPGFPWPDRDQMIDAIIDQAIDGILAHPQEPRRTAGGD